MNVPNKNLRTTEIVHTGYRPSNSSVTALLLKRTLYGLKQSGREWWKVLGDALAELGFKRCENEWGLYVRSDSTGPTMLLLAYVDDLVLAARTTVEIDTVCDALASKWKISRLGPIKHILGMKVTRDRSQRLLWITQPAYVDSLMQRFPGYTSTIAKYAPLPTRILNDDDFRGSRRSLRIPRARGLSPMARGVHTTRHIVLRLIPISVHSFPDRRPLATGPSLRVLPRSQSVSRHHSWRIQPEALDHVLAILECCRITIILIEAWMREYWSSHGEKRS